MCAKLFHLTITHQNWYSIKLDTYTILSKLPHKGNFPLISKVTQSFKSHAWKLAFFLYKHAPINPCSGNVTTNHKFSLKIILGSNSPQIGGYHIGYVEFFKFYAIFWKFTFWSKRVQKLKCWYFQAKFDIFS